MESIQNKKNLGTQFFVTIINCCVELRLQIYFLDVISIQMKNESNV